VSGLCRASLAVHVGCYEDDVLFAFTTTAVAGRVCTRQSLPPPIGRSNLEGPQATISWVMSVLRLTFTMMLSRS